MITTLARLLGLDCVESLLMTLLLLLTETIVSFNTLVPMSLLGLAMAGSECVVSPTVLMTASEGLSSVISTLLLSVRALILAEDEEYIMLLLDEVEALLITGRPMSEPVTPPLSDDNAIGAATELLERLGLLVVEVLLLVSGR